jgi:transcriptional regulator with XRE-family HTH domain
MKIELKTLGDNVRCIRKSLKISQEELARRCDFHRTYVCKLERGVKNVRLATLSKIAQGLGTTVSELTRQADEVVLVSARPSLPLALRESVQTVSV